MTTKMHDAPGNDASWGKKWVSAMAKTNHFSPHSVLLIAEGQGAKGSVVQLSGRSRSKVQALHTNPHLDISKPERRSVRWAISVFTGALQKEESKANHVGNGLGEGVVGVACNSKYAANDHDWDWVYSVGRWILLRVCF